jgi:uncharacterized membrane protein YoaK (UPF0700 family)
MLPALGVYEQMHVLLCKGKKCAIIVLKMLGATVQNIIVWARGMRVPMHDTTGETKSFLNAVKRTLSGNRKHSKTFLCALGFMCCSLIWA